LRAFRFWESFHGADASRLAAHSRILLTWLQQNRKPFFELVEDMPDLKGAQANPEALLLANVDAEMLRRAVEELPLEFREAIVLRNWKVFLIKKSVPSLPRRSHCDVQAGPRPHPPSESSSRRRRMNCEETQALLSAYVDGELDLVRSSKSKNIMKPVQRAHSRSRNQQTLGAPRAGSLITDRATPRGTRPCGHAKSNAHQAHYWPILAVAASLPAGVSSSIAW